MLLERLAEYADQINDLPPSMYQNIAARYLIKLDNEGHPLGGPIDRKTAEDKHGPEVQAPYLKRSVNVVPKLLVDTAEYVLGIGRAGSKPERVKEQHAAYVALVQLCAEVTGNPQVQAVERFLTNYRDELQMPADFEPAEHVMFEVDGQNPIRVRVVQDFWAKKAATGDDEEVMQCLVCGQVRPPVARLPISIKGIPGGQTSGMALISANAEAFESYGLEASLIAPTCETCGQRFGNALNALLKQHDTHLTIAPVAYIFWTKEPAQFSLLTLLDQAQAADVQTFLHAPWHSHPEAAKLEGSAFYAAALSASGARVVVRDWLETTLGDARRCLERYFRLQRIKDTEGADRFLPLRQLARATINAKSLREEPSAQVVEALFHMALHGGQLPDGLLYQVVRRVRSEQHISHAHAALIKMVLLSQQSFERIDSMAELDPNFSDAAYLCGRLLSVLETTQRVALGSVNATIVDRYYGTASAAPASVFGRLLRGTQPHLAKLRRNQPGAYYRLDEQLREICNSMGNDFPRTLDMKAQARFALGYYFQKTSDIQAGKTAKEAKRRGIQPPEAAGIESLAEELILSGQM